MKKYWIKDLTERQVIHAPTEEIAKKLCSKFHELGMKWSSGDSYLNEPKWGVCGEGTCYNKIGKRDSKACYILKGYEILTIDQLMDFQANEYPKVMEVSNDMSDWRKRVVIMEKRGFFMSWCNAETIEESEKEILIAAWKFAREVKPTLELTIAEIAEKFNVSPGQIKIKK